MRKLHVSIITLALAVLDFAEAVPGMCTIVRDCNGNARDVSGWRKRDPGCTCICKTGWVGRACEQADYPDCSNAAQGHCRTKAKSEPTGTSGPTCTCDCKGQWTAQPDPLDGLPGTCDYCPPLFDQTTCDACRRGYTGYPNCKQECTNYDCADRAANPSSVTGVVGECQCGACTDGWTGSTCRECPEDYDPVTCDKCAPGWFGTYPNCIRPCSSRDACNNRAAPGGVGGTPGNCTCDECRNGYEGESCGVCPTRYDYAQDCGECATGYEGSFPDCNRTCTNLTDCNGNAVSVSGNEGIGCRCDCAVNFDGGACERCATGYEDYPNCYLQCTNQTDCNERAQTVTGNVNSGCVCACLTGFAGDTCEECAPGYESYPHCFRICTNELDCGGGAESVSGNLNTSCTCECKSTHDGERCEACAAGYEAWPSCDRTCTNDLDCSGKAATVTGNLGSGCTCACESGFAGASCATCATGYAPYPNCYLVCTSAANCNGNAVEASGYVAPNGGCNCRCDSKYTGATCDACAPGFDGYPNCQAPQRPCTNQLDCMGRASAVSGQDASVGCTCTCMPSFAGPACNRCAPGLTNYPQCTPAGPASPAPSVQTPTIAQPTAATTAITPPTPPAPAPTPTPAVPANPTGVQPPPPPATPPVVVSACPLSEQLFTLWENEGHRVELKLAPQSAVVGCTFLVSCPATSSGFAFKATKSSPAGYSLSVSAKVPTAAGTVSQEVSGTGGLSRVFGQRSTFGSLALEIDATGTGGTIAVVASCLGESQTVPDRADEVNYVEKDSQSSSPTVVVTSLNSYRSFTGTQKAFLLSCSSSDMSASYSVAQLSAISGSAGATDTVTVTALDSGITRTYSGTVSQTFSRTTDVSGFAAASQYYVTTSSTGAQGFSVSFLCEATAWSPAGAGLLLPSGAAPAFGTAIAGVCACLLALLAAL